MSRDRGKEAGRKEARGRKHLWQLSPPMVWGEVLVPVGGVVEASALRVLVLLHSLSNFPGLGRGEQDKR